MRCAHERLEDSSVKLQETAAAVLAAVAIGNSGVEVNVVPRGAGREGGGGVIPSSPTAVQLLLDLC